MSLLKNLILLSCVVFLQAAVEANSSVTVTRDAFGVPTISGGNLASVSRAVGRLHAEDRLWQIFLQNIAANGRLAQYLGTSNPQFLESDIFQRQINPTDKEVEEQMRNLFTENAVIAFKNYVQGLNDRVDEVNANPALRPFELAAILGNDPIPHFTLYDNLRSVRFFFQAFSATQIPQYQLSNIAALQTLAASFGSTAGYAIFQDVDPTSTQVRSLVTNMQNNNATPHELPEQLEGFKTLDSQKLEKVQGISEKIRGIKELHKTLAPSLGSNGQAIGPEKSESGNPLLRCAIQPNFNHPSDFYQVKVDKSFFTGNYFIVPGIPFGIGIFNRFGFNAQTGHLPTNDFLFESIDNVSSSRTEVIKVLNEPDVIITVYRSRSGGWVIENPVSSTTPTTMLTLRSAFIERQLQGLNIIGDLPFINNLRQFFRRALQFDHTSDIIGFQGECADCEGNFGAYQATVWTELPSIYDRRLPQGVLLPGPPNYLYRLSESSRLPMYDINNKQGYYSGWNNLFKQFAAGSADTTTGIALSRAYWLTDYLNSFNKISFDDLKNLTFRQAVANSIVAFKNSRPTAFADLFTPLFKARFFQAITQQSSITPDQMAALALLQDFEGNWFDGTEAQVIATNDVSDKFILASAWLLNVAAEILNPFLNGTYFEINPGSAGVVNALPTLNAFQASNDLATYQGNLLARILGTSSDNTLLFPAWLEGVDVDQVIIDSLNRAIANLGGLGARPWGQNLRPIYQFKNAILGTVAASKIFNSSGLYFVAEFAPEGITRMETDIPLGESGEVLVGPGFTPVFAPHNFDQLPFYETFELIPN